MQTKVDDKQLSLKAKAAGVALVEVQKAIRFFRLYPVDHPFCSQAIDDTIDRMNRYLEAHGALEVDVGREGLTIGDQMVLRDSEQSTDLSGLLYPEGVRTLTIQPDVPKAELTDFVHILSAAYPEGQAQGEVSFAADLITALWRREFAHIRYRIHDQITPSAVGGQSDPGLSPVTERIQALMGELVGDDGEDGEEDATVLAKGNGDGPCGLDVQRFLDELGATKEERPDDIAAWAADPARAEQFRGTPEGSARQELLDELTDPVLSDNLARAADVVAWAAARDLHGPATDDVARFLAGATLNALTQDDLERALGLLERARSPDAMRRAVSERLLAEPSLVLLGTALAKVSPAAAMAERGLRYLGLLDGPVVEAICKAYPAVPSAEARKVLQRYLAPHVARSANEVAAIARPGEAVLIAEAATMLAAAGRDSRAWPVLEQLAAREPAARSVLEDVTGDKARRELMRTLHHDGSAQRRLEALAAIEESVTARSFDELAAVAQDASFSQREEEEVGRVLDLLVKAGGLRAVRVLQELAGRKTILFGRREAQRLSALASARLDRLRNR